MNNITNEQPLASSKLKWKVYFLLIPLFLLCTIVVIFYLIDIAQGGVMVEQIANSRRGGRIITLPFVGFGIGAVALWFYRKVKIYPDRMEVRYPLHKGWASTVMMKDVNEYCVEMREEGENINRRLFLLTGNKLWYYIGETECRNFDEMRDLLTDYFHIPQHEGIIELTKTDMTTVKHGGYILLED